MILKLGLVWCTCLGLLAAQQSPKDLFEKAPPDVDDALRARVEKFFQSYVDGKYRNAYETVAEDSQDTFFSADKYTCSKIELVKITYTEKFTRATALVNCTSTFSVHGTHFPTKIPLTSFWKLTNGKWYWYTVKNAETQTPFGTMHPGARTDAQPEARTLPKIPDLKDILGLVKLNKYEVRLSSYEPASDEVLVTNDMPGEISLSLEHLPMPGFAAKLDKAKLKTRETAKILFECKPEDKAAKRSLEVQLKVDPLQARIPIHVVFAIPPEIEKQLPK